MVQTGALLADMPVEPTIAVDSLSRMITSFIATYLRLRIDVPEANLRVQIPPSGYVGGDLAFAKRAAKILPAPDQET